MFAFDTYFASKWDPEEPWLILGKGPSFDRYLALPDDHGFRTLGLNNVCTQRPVDVALVIDLHNIAPIESSLRPCGDTGVLVMPWYPHIANKPARRNLQELAEDMPILRSLARQGRLATFNSSLSSRQPQGPGPKVWVRYFSGVAAVNLLAVCGVRKIRTLGMDGGDQYSSRFDPANLFLNTRSSFDIQFVEMRRSCKRYSLDLQPLEDM